MNSRIYVVSIVGIQNSGKSTLLMNLLGCDFIVKDGRCTQGATWKLLRANSEYLPDFEYFLIVDTEGLESKYNNNDPLYDRKLLLLTLATSHLVIINNNDELRRGFQDKLAVCINSLFHIQAPVISAPALLLVFN